MSSTLQNQLPPASGRPEGYPPDDPFLEALFGTMCHSLVGMPGEAFVDRAKRWLEGLRFAAALKPRNKQEWLQAVDVTTKQFCAFYSLVMQRHDGITRKQRLKHGQDYIVQLKAIHEARARYELLRKSRSV